MEQIELADEALAMLREIDGFYAERGRIEAQHGLRAALAEAGARIIAGRELFLDAPALSPGARQGHPLRFPGWRWVRARRYWFAFAAGEAGPIITACHHDTSPGTGPLDRARRITGRGGL